MLTCIYTYISMYARVCIHFFRTYARTLGAIFISKCLQCVGILFRSLIASHVRDSFAHGYYTISRSSAVRIVINPYEP